MRAQVRFEPADLYTALEQHTSLAARRPAAARTCVEAVSPLHQRGAVLMLGRERAGVARLCQARVAAAHPRADGRTTSTGMRATAHSRCSRRRPRLPAWPAS